MILHHIENSLPQHKNPVAKKSPLIVTSPTLPLYTVHVVLLIGNVFSKFGTQDIKVLHMINLFADPFLVLSVRWWDLLPLPICVLTDSLLLVEVVVVVVGARLHDPKLERTMSLVV